MKIKKLLGFIISTVMLCGCGTSSYTGSRDFASEAASSAESYDTEIPDDHSETESDFAMEIPAGLEEIPSDYYSQADRQGTLEELNYETYESFSYEEKTQKLNKRAIVYLPYGYNENEQYNIFYLMHGGWSDETTTLGTPDSPNQMKNVVDHAIEDGRMQPMIIVCPTYNNTSSDDSSNFSLAMDLTRNYYNELLNDLIPAAEGKYHTYADSTSAGDLAASREHRGFGGFSMGSVATWWTFRNCLDYFKYFMPMSCGAVLDDEYIFKAARGYSQNDYFVFIMTGTDDFAYSYDNDRVDKMRSSEYFTEGRNFAYRVKDGYSHDGLASMEYTYNGLIRFWNTRNTAVFPYKLSRQKR